MSDALEIIAEQIKEKRQKRLRFTARAEAIKRCIIELDSEIRVLETVNEKIKSSQKNNSDGDLPPADHPSEISQKPILLGPTAAIKSLLEENPDGLTSEQILEVLEGTIKTNSSNRRRVLYQTLFSLKKQEEVYEENGIYHFSEK